MNVDFANVAAILLKSPAGKNNPINGVIISVTNAVTNLEAAAPMTNAIANPIIPNVLRKSKNSCANDVFTGTSVIDVFFAHLIIMATDRKSDNITILFESSKKLHNNLFSTLHLRLL